MQNVNTSLHILPKNGVNFVNAALVVCYFYGTKMSLVCKHPFCIARLLKRLFIFILSLCLSAKIHGQALIKEMVYKYGLCITSAGDMGGDEQ